MSAQIEDRPALSACADPQRDARHPRWAVWRSPEGQPPWARPVLLGIAAVAALLYSWNIAKAGYAPYYSDAVKSMSESWKAFFYGTWDKNATITIDKLAGSFLPQAVSARIFGYHAWSLALPQVIEGIVSVLVMYRVVRRWVGAVPGLLAAGIFALTPIAASMFGHSMEDGALTMCLVLAADAYQRAVQDARLRSLVWSGIWVGLGFQAKMLQAWLILPALAIGYLLTAPTGLGRRLRQLGIAAAVMLVVSLSWIALYTFTPAHDRPVIAGSTDKNALVMVFGYNGLGRFGIDLPGASESGSPVHIGKAASSNQPSAGSQQASVGNEQPLQVNTSHPGQSFISLQKQGWAKLARGNFAPEIGWLYPLALLTLILGLRRKPRGSDEKQLFGGFVMWGVWLVSVGFIFSAMSAIPHQAYLASLAPPIAALSGAGIVMFWKLYRSRERYTWALVPLVIAAELAWSAWLWSGYSTFLPWALWATVAGGAAAIAVLIAGRLSKRDTTRVAAAGLTVGMAAMLASPAIWAGSVLDVKYAGTSFDAGAGPAGAGPVIILPGSAIPGSKQGHVTISQP
jgi:4-amino-4-deoxy-L-arabinose transferase-like glycosyltransferase